MQYSSNNTNLYGNEKNNRLKYIAIGSVIFLLIVLLLALSLRSPQETSLTDSDEYFDPGSGETVSNPEGKSPETYGVEGDDIVYLGFSKLLDVGVTSFQVDAAKIAFEVFSDRRTDEINEVSIFVDTIQRVPFDNQSSNEREVTFKVRINRSEEFDATILYSSIRSAQLVLEDQGREVFKSEMINPNEYRNQPEGDLYLEPQYR
jgi:hypothetical protein